MKSGVGVLLFLVLFCAVDADPAFSTWTCDVTTTKGNVADERSRSCVLENICYKQGEYQFYQGKKKRGLPLSPLVELGVYPSSPKLELAIQKGYAPMEGSRSVRWVNETSVLYDRCCQHNYFHGLLDAYLGVHWMLNKWSRETRRNLNHRLFWADDKKKENMPGWFNAMATTMSKHPFESMHDVRGTICWKRLIVGPAGHQLGGPGQYLITKKDMMEYRSFLLRAMRLKEGHPKGGPIITLVNRPVGSNRRIVNEQAVVDALRGITKTASGRSLPQPPRVKVVTWENASFRDQARRVLRSHVLVSMHGAAMANLLFLPEDASVVEIFPYRVNRPLYRTIAGKRDLPYFFWENPKERDTTFHPEILQRVSAEDRAVFMADPMSMSKSMMANKYWLDQDTVVGDLEAFVRVVQQALDVSFG